MPGSARFLLVVLAAALVATAAGDTCDCVGDMCGCCLHIDVPEVHLNSEVCANISYIPSILGLNLLVTIGSFVAFNDTVSLSNPSVCFGVPYLESLAKFCIDFYNMTYSTSAVTGCVKLEIDVVEIKVGTFNLGCFDLPLLFATPMEQAQFAESLPKLRMANALHEQALLAKWKMIAAQQEHQRQLQQEEKAMQ